MKKLLLILAASAVLFACGNGGNKKASTERNHWDEVLDEYEALVDHHLDFYEEVMSSPNRKPMLNELHEIAVERSDFEEEINESIDKMNRAQKERFKKINQRFYSNIGM